MSESLPHVHGLHGASESAPAPHDGEGPPGPGDRRVHHLTLEHDVVFPGKSQDDSWILSTLRLVNRDRPGGLEVLERWPLVVVYPSIERDANPLGKQGDDPPLIAVEQLPVIVVSELHDTIPLEEESVSVDESRPFLPTPLLDDAIQPLGSQGSLAHGRENLHVVGAAQSPAIGEDVQHEIPDPSRRGFRVVSLVEIDSLAQEMVFIDVTGEDGVGQVDDGAALRLAEDLVEPLDGHLAARDQVAEDAARTDAGQLVRVSHEEQTAAFGHRAEKVNQKRDIQHRDLVDDHEVRGEGEIATVNEGPFVSVELEKSMDGLGFQSRDFFQAFGGAPGRTAQSHLGSGVPPQGDDAFQNSGLAHARSARQNGDLGIGKATQNLGLLGGQPVDVRSHSGGRRHGRLRLAGHQVEQQIRRLPFARPGKALVDHIAAVRVPRSGDHDAALLGQIPDGRPR